MTTGSTPRVRRIALPAVDIATVTAHADTPQIFGGVRNAWPWVSQWTLRRMAHTLADVQLRLVSNEGGPCVSQHPDFTSVLRETNLLGRELLTLESTSTASQVRMRFDDATLRTRLLSGSARRALGFRLLTSHSGVWASSPGSRTPVHADPWPGALLQVDGTKSVSLAAPSEVAAVESAAWELRHAAGSMYALCQTSEKARTINWRHTLLRAGEVLLIPAGWFHDVTSYSCSVSAVLRFRGPATDD